MIINQYYFRPDAPRLRLLFCGDEDCRPFHEFGGKRPYFLIHVILKGRGSYHWRRKSWRLGPGDGFVIFPEEKHFYRADGRDPWHYYWLALDQSIGGYLREQGVRPDQPILRSENLKELEELYARLRPPEGRAERGSPLGQYEAACGILARLLSGSAPREAAPGQALLPDHVKTMQSFIRSYYQTPISAADVASYACLERSYASRLFKETEGRGIAQAIRELRLEKSREFLREGYSVKQASYSAGFPVYENFLKLFKRVYGETPGSYRKRAAP